MNISAFVGVLIKYTLLQFWWHKPNFLFERKPIIFGRFGWTVLYATSKMWHFWRVFRKYWFQTSAEGLLLLLNIFRTSHSHFRLKARDMYWSRALHIALFPKIFIPRSFLSSYCIRKQITRTLNKGSVHYLAHNISIR